MSNTIWCCMNVKSLLLISAVGLVLLNPVIGQQDTDRPDTRTVPLSDGNATFSVEDGVLTISATLEAYPEAKLFMEESSDGEDYGSKENISSETKEYDLIFEKARGIESLYKQNITVSENIEIENTTDLLFKYKVSESEREIRRMKSGTLITVTPERITSITKNNRYNSISPGDQSRSSSETSNQQYNSNQQNSLAPTQAGNVNSTSTQNIRSPVNISEQVDLEVSQSYQQELDGMSKKELKNRVIYLRKKVIELERAMLGVSESVSAVEDLVEADMSSDGIDVESSKQEKEDEDVWSLIVESVF